MSRVGTWASAFSVPTIPNDLGDLSRAFGIQAVFYDGNEQVGLTQRIQCTTHMPYAQMVSGQLIAPANYSSVKISLEYNYNTNTAYFTLPYLYRENYGQSYEYDDNGQLVGSVNTDDTESTYEYNDDYQLSSLLSVSGNQSNFAYNEKNQLITTYDSTGVRADYVYDAYGNTKQTITSDMKATQPVDGGRYYIVNAASGQAIGVGAHITASLESLSIGENCQQWYLEEQGDGKYIIHSFASDESDPFALNVYENMGLEEYNGWLNVQGVTGDTFRFVKQPDGTFAILTSDSDFTKCLTVDIHDVEGEGVCEGTYTEGQASSTQKWWLYDVDPTNVAFIKTYATYITGEYAGNFPLSTTDALGKTTTYEYDQRNGLLKSVTNGNGVTATYTYNEQNGSVSTVTVDGKTISYTYDTADRLDTLTAPNGIKYHFVYDTFGRNTAIEIVGETDNDTVTLCQWVYDADGLLTEQRYANGARYTYAYDELDRPIGVYANDAQLQAYYYNADGDIAAVIDIPDRKAIRYVLDAAGRVEKENTYVYNGTATDTAVIIDELLKSTTVKYQAVYGYDDTTGYLREETNATPMGSTEYTYTYGDPSAGEMPDAIYAVESTPSLTGDEEKVEYEYDGLGRIVKRIVHLNTGSTKTTEYTYKAGGHGANSTTTQLDTITTDGVQYQYTYDNVGRIVKITKNGTEVESYVYDSLGQLIQVKQNGTVIASYTYDNGGNITSSTVNGVTKNYTYGNATWKDQLTAFNGNAITYDAQGNPLTYHDGAVMTWANGRNMMTYTKGDTAVSFTYASDNTRTTKTVNGVTTTYYYVGGRLYGEMTGNNKLIYLYDDTGSPYGYIYNDTAYYYEKNAQGDVIGLFHQNGKKIANYTYDAWGNITSIKNQYGEDVSSQPRHQANLNPIRYRGYYYDVELKMYWLTTRFYDPAIGRFINADTQLNDGMLGNNLYAYCGNDPVNGHDPTGTCTHNTMGFDCSACREAMDAEYNTPILENFTYIIDEYSSEWWIVYNFSAIRYRGEWIDIGEIHIQFKTREDDAYKFCVNVLDAFTVYQKKKLGNHSEWITVDGGKLILNTEVHIITYIDIDIPFFEKTVSFFEWDYYDFCIKGKRYYHIKNFY